jgi:cysteine desulfurase
MKRRAYFDNASTTPLDRRVLKEMMPYFTEHYGNASNLYENGRCARKAIEKASEQIAKALHCRADEFVFTGSATEADNLALAGTAHAHRFSTVLSSDGVKQDESNGRIIISALEHKGIMAVCDALEKEGFEIIKLPVGTDGLVSPDEVRKNLNDKTIIVSVTMADSETGTLQPIREIAEVIRKFRDERSNSKSASIINNQSPKTNSSTPKPYPLNPNSLTPNFSLPYFHTDASQAATYADVNVEKLGVDLMTLSAHKLRGPKGIGGLYVRRGLKLKPIIYGGGQQGKLRSGTENVPAIVGFGKAMELNEAYKKKGVAHVRKLRDTLQKGIFKSINKVVLNGHPTKRLANFLNISILDIEGESLLLELDEYGIMINTGSACNSESLEPSYVLTALGNPYEFVHGSIRFTLGSETGMSDIRYVLKCLPKIVTRLRRISPLDLSGNEKKAISDPRAFIGGKTPHFLKKSKLKNPPASASLQPPPFSKGEPVQSALNPPLKKGVPEGRGILINKK